MGQRLEMVCAENNGDQFGNHGLLSDLQPVAKLRAINRPGEAFAPAVSKAQQRNAPG